jgi:RNA polymerase sigma-70 factor (ECF subfamily)
MRRIAAGDEVAFKQLVGYYGDSLARTISRLTGWSRDSDDIFQEVLILVWQRARQFDGRGSLEGWLKQIAINKCRNHFRLTNSIQRKLERFAEWLGGQLTEKSCNEFVANDHDDRVRSALARLSAPDRTVLVLFYLEEMSGDDVANALKISLSAVHVRLHRARKRLKEIWNDEENTSAQ